MKNYNKYYIEIIKINKLILLIVIIIIYIPSWSQEFILLGEGNKDEVRLFWIPKISWHQEATGVNIKRKSENGQWEKLNGEIIVPGTAQSKPLNNIGLSGIDLDHLNNKREELIQSGQLKEIESIALINFIKDANMLKSVSLMLNSDFDISLIAGFGYVDMNIPNVNGKYEYGLFLVRGENEEDSPVATYQWTYGSSPQINVSMEGKVKPNKSRKTVELTWKVGVEEYKSYGILNGFNVFRKQSDGEFVKLSDKPIWISLKEKASTLYFRDMNVDMDKEYIYAAAPNTIFNTSGVFSELKLEPVQDIPEMKPPQLENPEYEQGQLNINWKFDSNNEQHIKGFYVQRKQDEGNLFTNVSELLTPNTRTYTYSELPNPDNVNYHFKVIAVSKDERELWSNRKIYFHQKQTKPSVPQNLQGQIDTEGSHVKVQLIWEAPELNAQSVTEYYLYTSYPNDERVVKDNSVGKITSTSAEYIINKNGSANYYFAVSSVNDNYEESGLSNKIKVVVPSKSLPFIDIWPVGQEGNTVTLNWKYSDEILDLSGFRIFQNEQLIADEKAIDKTTRTWTVSNLEEGNYTFEMIAITNSGVESKRSKPRTFEVK